MALFENQKYICLAFVPSIFFTSLFRYLKKVISENASAEDTLQLFKVRRPSDVLPTS